MHSNRKQATTLRLVKDGDSMLKKLKDNNKAGADLQFAIGTFLFIFVVSVSLLIDFWYVSSAKVAILKTVEESELYCLVTNAPQTGEGSGGYISSSDSLQDMIDMDLIANQNAAVQCSRPELISRLNKLPYLKDTDILSVTGLNNPIGQMGVRTQMRYQIKTLIRTPGQIFNFMKKSEDPKITSAEWIPLTVTSKMVPILTDKTFT